MSPTGVLYIVPTPIGNLSDMTPRAVEVLRSADRILCEDTRTSATLLKHFGIAAPLSSYHKFNEHETTVEIINEISSGKTIALISDAGTPGVSDPGFMLARECRNRGVDVITLPGATAFVPALVNSGLPCDRFFFEGFLPVKKGRESRIKEIAKYDVTTIIYESPLRLLKTLQDLAGICGEEREASVSREISKLYEQTLRGTLSELISYFTQTSPKGEFVIILGASRNKEKKIHVNKYRNS